MRISYKYTCSCGNNFIEYQISNWHYLTQPYCSFCGLAMQREIRKDTPLAEFIAIEDIKKGDLVVLESGKVRPMREDDINTGLIEKGD